MSVDIWNKFRLLSPLLIIVLLAMSGPVDGAAFCTKDDRCAEPFKNQARYDHYRIYNVELDTEEKVELFKKLEEQCDSMIFIGHAREVGQKLSILVSAHKVADLADLLEHYQVKHRILVSIRNTTSMGSSIYIHSVVLFYIFSERHTISKRKSIKTMPPSCLSVRISRNLIGIITIIWKLFTNGWNRWPRNIPM